MNTTETARGSLQLNHIRSLVTKLSNMDEHARVMFVEANHTIPHLYEALQIVHNEIDAPRNAGFCKEAVCE